MRKTLTFAVFGKWFAQWIDVLIFIQILNATHRRMEYFSFESILFCFILYFVSKCTTSFGLCK